jgi:hypothetical protein
MDLSAQEERELLRRSAKYTLPYFEVMRARMVLRAAEGMSNDRIAARLDTRREIVSMWRKRFFEERLAGLDERARPGRPRNPAFAIKANRILDLYERVREGQPLKSDEFVISADEKNQHPGPAPQAFHFAPRAEAPDARRT